MPVLEAMVVMIERDHPCRSPPKSGGDVSQYDFLSLFEETRRVFLPLIPAGVPSDERISRTSTPGSGSALLSRSQSTLPSRPTSFSGSGSIAARDVHVMSAK